MSEPTDGGPIPTVYRSKVGTNNGPQNGIFERTDYQFTSEAQIRESLRQVPEPETWVMARLDELEQIAFAAIQAQGFNGFADNVLFVNGKRSYKDVPKEFWSGETKPDRLKEIIAELGYAGQNCTWGKACDQSVHPPLSSGEFAASLHMRVKMTRKAIETGEFWQSLQGMAVAEQVAADLNAKLLEKNYVAMARELGEHRKKYQSLDWDLVMADWISERAKHGNRGGTTTDKIIAKRWEIQGGYKTVENKRGPLGIK